MENYFINITAKVWANLDNPMKSYDFSKFWLISCMPPSQVALCYANICDVTTVGLLSNGTVPRNFSWKCIFPLLLYLGICYRAKMIVHAFYDWTWSTGLLIFKRKKNCEILCTNSMESCSLVISQILAQFRLERATYKTLHD